MEELHFSGNCLKGSRPILSFDAAFDTAPHLQLIKELLLHNFGVPKGARKSKPFIDHVMAFTIADGKIWVRCYQINETEVSKQQQQQSSAEGDAKEGHQQQQQEQQEQQRHGSTKEGGTGKTAGTSIDLVEIGPRFVLTPIVILEGSFGGPLIYENKEFVSPNQIRAELRLRRAGKHSRRSDKAMDRTVKLGSLALRTETAKRKPKSELDESVLFA
jgi:ribosome biogenesis protein BRX1